MQAGHVTLTTTTSQVVGPVAGASHVTLFGQNGGIYLASSAGIDTTDSGNRAELCLLQFPASSGVGCVSLRIGEGESIFAAGDGGSQSLDYVVFPV